MSIAVAPANPSVAKGLAEQFTATGTYTDGSTANLTTQVDWVSGRRRCDDLEHRRQPRTGFDPGTGTTAITADLGGSRAQATR